MKDPRTIIKRPLLTEKGSLLKEQANQYLFEVATDANKVEIARAIEVIFRVNVLSVNTIPIKGKEKRLGRFVGRTPDRKKAVVTIQEGQNIEFFEGV
ncbi:MAG: 50S ribosomal protein L23 [candidate division NC10 bacterium]|nr:50S ribosomal protein L23 [candidate division NC10 bacterium]